MKTQMNRNATQFKGNVNKLTYMKIGSFFFFLILAGFTFFKVGKEFGIW